MEMTIDGHDKGSERSHNRKKEENAREVGIKRMSDEEFDKKMVELKTQLNYVEKLATGK
jgi:hypothetical protein